MQARCFPSSSPSPPTTPTLSPYATLFRPRGTPSASLVEVLRASEERFRALLDSAPDAAVIVDGFGCITLNKENTDRNFSYTREELIVWSVEFLLPDQLQAIHVGHRNGYRA